MAMPPFLADENLNNDLIRSLLSKNEHVDIVRVQDVGLSGADDSVVLAWAADEGRVLLTHDFTTVPAFARDRIQCGERMAGVIVVPQDLSPGRVVEDLLLVWECSLEGEWEDRVLWLPL